MPEPLETLRFLLPDWIAEALAGLPRALQQSLREVYLRVGQPPEAVGSLQGFLGEGELHPLPENLRCAEPEDISHLYTMVLQLAPYGSREQANRGSITLPGGVRVGLAGEMADGESGKVLCDCGGAVLRLLRPVPGASEEVAPRLRKDGGWYSTLIVSPPGMGKTTMLRDLSRVISSGPRGSRVTLVDSRGELAGWDGKCYTCDIGPRTNVISGCEKAQGLGMALRNLAPEVLITDEIGVPEDAEAIREATRCGVTVIASAHAGSLSEAGQRPLLRELLRQRLFQRGVSLGGTPGRIREIVDLEWEEKLL